MLVVYAVVFSVIFRARWPGVTNNLDFAGILFAGPIANSLSAECVSRAPTLILSNVTIRLFHGRSWCYVCDWKPCSPSLGAAWEVRWWAICVQKVMRLVAIAHVGWWRRWNWKSNRSATTRWRPSASTGFPVRRKHWDTLKNYIDFWSILLNPGGYCLH